MRALLAVRRLPSWTLPLLLAALAAALPQLGANLEIQRQIILISILTLLVSGLNLSFGYAGELALGGAAVYAAGAYLAGYLGAHGYTDILLQFVAALAAALAVGLITGIPGLRLGGWSLAMVSFFLILLVPDILAILAPETGGAVGLVGIGLPTLFGHILSQNAYFTVAVVATVAWLAFLRNLVTSRHGTALLVLRHNPVLAAASGISVYRTKLVAYALSSVPAGIAGVLFANLDHYLSPLTFSFALVISILAASILGGLTSVYGAIIGAVIMQLGPLEATDFQSYALVVYGAFLLVGGALLGDGITGTARRLWAWSARHVAARLAAYGWLPPEASMAARPAAGAGAGLGPIPGGVLQVSAVSKRFVKVQALSNVTLTARPGEVTALIGPNGSGKTTLLNVICGFYRKDEGTVTIDGASPVPRPDKMARAGVARTFQTPLVPPGLTVGEVVASGRYMTHYRSIGSAVLRLPSYRRASRQDRVEALRVLESLGIAEQAGGEAAALPLGTRRLIEVGRALIAQPRVLLLDEAASGLDESEVERLSQIIRRIRAAGGTVILVEHNLGLVRRLADQVYVLAQGKIISAGPPPEISQDPVVLREYLGQAPAETGAPPSPAGPGGQPGRDGDAPAALSSEEAT